MADALSRFLGFTYTLKLSSTLALLPAFQDCPILTIFAVPHGTEILAKNPTRVLHKACKQSHIRISSGCRQMPIHYKVCFSNLFQPFILMANVPWNWSWPQKIGTEANKTQK